MKKVLLAVALASCASASLAGDAEFERAKAEFESIARQDEVGRARRGEPSLTTLVRTLLARDPALVMRVEAHCWNAAKREDLWASRGRAQIETAIQFLHANDSPCLAVGDFEQAAFVTLVGGAVVVRHGDPYFGLATPPFAGTYEELIKGRGLRQLPAPSAAALFAAAEDPEAHMWAEAPIADLGMALGETCVDDDDAFEELIRASATRKPAYLVALGWTRRPAAAETLVEHLRALFDCDHRDKQEAIDAAAIALSHADGDAFARLVASLDAARGDGLVGATGAAPLVDRLLGRLAAAADVGRGRSEFCDAVRANARRLRGSGLDRLLRVLHAACADPECRSAAIDAADELLDAKRSGMFGSSGTNGRREEGAHVGWPGAIEELVRRLVEDFDAGRLTVADAAPSFATARTPEDCGPRVRNRLFGDGAPVHVRGEWTESGLRLTFRNDGATPLSMDATAMRYAAADTVTVTPDGAEPDRRLRLAFGRTGFRAFTPADTLATLAPGADWTCSLPVAVELRRVDHVEIDALGGRVMVVGTASAPIARFAEKIVEFGP